MADRPSEPLKVSNNLLYYVYRKSILGSNPSSVRTGLYDLISSTIFSRISLLVVVVNVVLVVVEYFFVWPPCDDNCIGDFVGFLVFYTMETVLKLFAYRGAFFWDPFNVLDLILVALQTANMLKSMAMTYITTLPERTLRTLHFTFNVLTSLNALRIARLLRHLNTLRLQGRVIVYCFKDIIYVYLYMIVISYVFATFGVAYLGNMEAFPTIGKALWNLLLIMTLDDWSSAFRPGGEDAPDADLLPFVFAFSFLLLQTFLLLSLLTAMLLSTYLSEVKRIRAQELSDYDASKQARESMGSKDFGSISGSKLWARSSNIGSYSDDDDWDDDEPPDEDDRLTRTYEYFQRKWNQLSQIFLELTVVMNGVIYITTEIMQSS